MGVLDRAKAHYKERLSSAPRSITIPGWGEDGADLVAYVRPQINLASVTEITDMASNGKMDEAMALTLIYRLVDEDGNALFKKSDRLDLVSSVDPDIITGIITQINSTDPTSEELEKN